MKYSFEVISICKVNCRFLQKKPGRWPISDDILHSCGLLIGRKVKKNKTNKQRKQKENNHCKYQMGQQINEVE